MAKLKKGQKLVCVPCGREVVVSNLGAASTTIWCCSKPMQKKVKSTKAKKRNKR